MDQIVGMGRCILYSVNTKDKEVVAAQKKVKEIALAHKYIRQVHGFYLMKEQKRMRFDLVVSFDAENREEAFRAAVEDVKKAFPGYELQVAMDADFMEE